MDLDSFLKIIHGKCQLNPEQLIIAGVSGGPDSLCLLHLLHRLKLPVVAVHVNHQLREEATHEAELVKQFCLQNEIRCVIGTVAVKEFSAREHLSIEEAARILRYQYLFEQARKMDAQAVLVAHNADDQVETVLMHLIRGTGLSGLKGMEMKTLIPTWSPNIPLIRPLLTTTRTEIMNYCNSNGLSPVFDQSNEDERYFRNRIRHSLVPELATYNSQITKRILNMSDVLAKEDDFLTETVNEEWNKALLGSSSNFLVFKCDPLKACHPALLRRLLRKIIQTLNVDSRNIDLKTIEQAENFLGFHGNANHLSWFEGIEIIRYQKDKLIFCKENDPLDEFWPQVNSKKPLDLITPGKTQISESWEIESKKKDAAISIPSDNMVCVVDADRAVLLCVDVFHPGDRFAPFGLEGKSLKLGDYWTNRGLPEKARKCWPLIKSGNEIVWIPGFQIGETYKVTDNTKRVILLSVKRRDSLNSG